MVGSRAPWILRWLFVLGWGASLHVGSSRAVNKIVIIRELLRNVSDDILPDSLDFVLTRDNTDLPLHLKRSKDVDINAPIYIPRNTSGRNELTRGSVDELSYFGLYQDKTNGAAILVTCKRADQRRCYHELEGGLLVVSNKEYLLKPSDDKRVRAKRNFKEFLNERYEMSEISGTGLGSSDYRKIPGGAAKQIQVVEQRPITPSSLLVKRPRRASQTQYYIDVVIVIDYSVYREWFRRSGKSTVSERDVEAKNEIRKYFSLLMNTINIRYKSLNASDFGINVRLAGYVILEDESAAHWIEKNKEPADGNENQHLINVDNILKEFRDWLSEETDFPMFDHVMLFTKYDLYSNMANRKITATSGIAYMSSVCTKFSISVVEAQGGMKDARIAAHELGHSLGSKHDGEQNNCISSDQYIMAASGGLPSLEHTNPWHFSSCSVNYFRIFLESRTRQLYVCHLKKTRPVDIVYQKRFSGKMPGQVYSVDEQCKQILGNESYLCRNPSTGSLHDVCTLMFCSIPASRNLCQGSFAARGTSCGNKKWCIDGHCAYSSQAPALSDDCLFGDKPFEITDGKTCGELVETAPTYCGSATFRKFCCQTCADLRNGGEHRSSRNMVVAREWNTSRHAAPSTAPSSARGTSRAGTLTPPTRAHRSDTSDCNRQLPVFGRKMCNQPRTQTTCDAACLAAVYRALSGCSAVDAVPLLCGSVSVKNPTLCLSRGRPCCKTCLELLGAAGRHPPSPAAVMIASLLSLMTFYSSSKV